MSVSVSDPPAAAAATPAADSIAAPGRRVLGRLLPWLVLPLTLGAGIFLLLHFYQIPSVHDPNPLGIALIVLLTGVLIALLRGHRLLPSGRRRRQPAGRQVVPGGNGIHRRQLLDAASRRASLCASTSTSASWGSSPATGSALLGLEIVLATLVPAAISLFALLLFLPQGGPAVVAALAVMVGGAVGVLAFIRSDAYNPVIVRLPLPRIVRRALAPNGDIVAALRRVPLGSLGASAGIFAATWVLVGIRSFCAFQLFGGSMNVVELVGISAAAFTLGSLSLLPMGLGVRDATLVALFVQAGADRDVAIAVAAFDRLLSTGVPLLLGILSAQILGLRAIPRPGSRKTSSTAAKASESAAQAPRPKVRLGTHYRWVLTSALWPPNGAAPRTLDVGCHSGFWLHQQAPGCDARVGCDLASRRLFLRHPLRQVRRLQPSLRQRHVRALHSLGRAGARLRRRSAPARAVEGAAARRPSQALRPPQAHRNLPAPGDALAPPPLAALDPHGLHAKRGSFPGRGLWLRRVHGHPFGDPVVPAPIPGRFASVGPVASRRPSPRRRPCAKGCSGGMGAKGCAAGRAPQARAAGHRLRQEPAPLP